MQKHAHLPRLPDPFYHGYAAVHWILTMDDRKSGWLNELFHARFREVLLHAAGRYHISCPVYCLMPDHVHVIWIGTHMDSNQQHAMKFFKRYIAGHLHPFKLQKQSYDNVLREKDRERNAFQSTCYYILENPVRAGLISTANTWPFSGALVPGYPDLSPHTDVYWDLFWRLYAGKQLFAGVPKSELCEEEIQPTSV